LKNFWYKDFDTMEEMQTFFLGILSKVKHYVLVMKENMK
jgi:hypothetical protein